MIEPIFLAFSGGSQQKLLTAPSELGDSAHLVNWFADRNGFSSSRLVHARLGKIGAYNVAGFTHYLELKEEISRRELSPWVFGLASRKFSSSALMRLVGFIAEPTMRWTLLDSGAIEAAKLKSFDDLALHFVRDCTRSDNFDTEELKAAFNKAFGTLDERIALALLERRPPPFLGKVAKLLMPRHPGQAIIRTPTKLYESLNVVSSVAQLYNLDEVDAMLVHEEASDNRNVHFQHQLIERDNGRIFQDKNPLSGLFSLLSGSRGGKFKVFVAR